MKRRTTPERILAEAHRDRNLKKGNWNMPRTSEMIQSKYLKTADVPDPVIVTVIKVGKVNIDQEQMPPTRSYKCCHPVYKAQFQISPRS
jgi:hypothetical protein